MGASTGSATVTAPAGADEASVAQVYNDIRDFRVDIEHELISITLNTGRVVEYAYDTVATLTYVIANKVATITVST